MIIPIPKLLVVMTVFSMLFFSCTKEVDFDKANNLVLEPVVESSFIFLDESVNAFLDNGLEIEIEPDFIEIDFFNNAFIKKSLIKAEFVFETQNTVNRAFELQIDFYDVIGSEFPSNTIIVTENASSTNSDVETIHTEVFEGDALERLKNTKIAFFSIRMLPGGAIDNTTMGQIIVKSKAVMYFNIEDEG